jgi:hypothetical protein
MANELSPTMRQAIDYALKHSEGVRENAVLVRFPGGFWGLRTWKPSEIWFGTTTVEGIVKRGAGEYVKWQEGKHGKFPIEVQITL